MELISKRQVDHLAAMGRYFEAEQALYHNKYVKTTRAARLKRQMEEEQMLQWQAFERAKREFNLKEQCKIAAREQAKRDALRCKYQEDRQAHEEELEVFATRETTAMMRQPIALSAYAMSLKREEKHLSSQRQFAEAAVLQGLAQQAECGEHEAALAMKERLLVEKIERKGRLYREKERTALKNLRARLQLEQQASAPRLACAQARLQHMASDMAAAHGRQRKALRQLGFVPPMTNSEFWKSHRGSLLERRVIGNSYDIPSLCNLYGHLLQDTAVNKLPPLSLVSR